MIRTKYLYHYLTTHKKNPPLSNLPTLESLKKEYIRYLLKVTDSNLSEAAEILNISREALYNKLDKYHFRH